MLYSFVELPDKTIISHSEILNKDGREQVKVYMETPDAKLCFKHATCYLPDENWEEVYGYTEKEINYLKEFVSSEKSLIIELAKNGGFENAANF